VPPETDNPTSDDQTDVQLGYTEPAEQAESIQDQFGLPPEALGRVTEGEKTQTMEPDGSEGEPAKTPPQGEQPAAEPIEPYFDAEIFDWGAKIGMTAEDIRSFKSVDAAVEAIEQRVAGMQYAQRQAQSAAPQQLQTPTTQTPQTPSARKHFDITVSDEELPGMTAQLRAVHDGIDKGFVQAATVMLDHHRQLEQARQEIAALQEVLFDVQLNAALGSLDPGEWGEELGVGRRGSLAPNSPAFTNMRRVKDRVKLEQAIHARNGRRPTLEELVANALPVVFADKYRTRARNQNEAEVRRFANQTVGRPTHGRPPANNSPAARAAKAARRVDEWRAKVGAAAVDDFGL
jgi:hypothetical protein